METWPPPASLVQITSSEREHSQDWETRPPPPSFSWFLGCRSARTCLPLVTIAELSGGWPLPSSDFSTAKGRWPVWGPCVASSTIHRGVCIRETWTPPAPLTQITSSGVEQMHGSGVRRTPVAPWPSSAFCESATCTERKNPGKVRARPAPPKFVLLPEDRGGTLEKKGLSPTTGAISYFTRDKSQTTTSSASADSSSSWGLRFKKIDSAAAISVAVWDCIRTGAPGIWLDQSERLKVIEVARARSWHLSWGVTLDDGLQHCAVNLPIRGGSRRHTPAPLSSGEACGIVCPSPWVPKSILSRSLSFCATSRLPRKAHQARCGLSPLRTSYTSPI